MTRSEKRAGTEGTSEERSPERGGCWICRTGNGYENDDMEFDMEFDTFYHPDCLDEEEVDSILEYERNS